MTCYENSNVSIVRLNCRNNILAWSRWSVHAQPAFTLSARRLWPARCDSSRLWRGFVGVGCSWRHGSSGMELDRKSVV